VISPEEEADDHAMRDSKKMPRAEELISTNVRQSMVSEFPLHIVDDFLYYEEASNRSKIVEEDDIY
jgi:hypothetical protein